MAMEIGNNLLASLQGQFDPSRGPADAVELDWAALRARCVAGHAARLALQDGAANGLFPSGGFGDWTRVASGSRNHASRVVNRTDLADGKFPARNGGAVASDAVVGGRG